MFTFFSKKEYLVDHLSGFVDIHNHILPGIDDGAKNIEESIKLIKGFLELGVTNFICTPHIMHNYHENTPKTIKKAFKLLEKGIEKNNIKNIYLDYSAEHMIDDNFESLLETDNILPLKSNHLLIEMSYLQPSINFDVSVEKIKQLQMFPLLAHPERYHYLNSDKKSHKKIKSMGVKYQLNMLSLSNYYGKEVQSEALKLLNNDQYDFVGSDVHNLKHLNYLKNNVTIDKRNLNKVLLLINKTIETFY